MDLQLQFESSGNMRDIEMAALHLGLCGWSGSQRSYFADFGCIEIQSTFYDPPALAVARKWRASSPPGFEFCIKAWQLITHTAASPTYRRLRSPIAANERDSFGSFRQTDQVWQAWQRTLEIARALEARVILFQCPKSFHPTTENLINLSAFFRRVERADFRLAWEPRGEFWAEDVVREVCADNDLIHCVDPFQAIAVHGDIKYWRLHGRGSYSYRYTDADLAALRHMLNQQPQPGYLMFNNFSSKADALRFRRLLSI
jgi:uncharacterized protein YecE (DUF72 family)